MNKSNKYSIIIIFLFISVSLVNSQTVNLLGKEINFAISDSNLNGTFWEQGGQIESDYPYIKVYEYGDDIYSIYGYFYNSKLVCIDISIYNNDIYPSIEDIENLLIAIEPYKNAIEDVGAVEISEYYKTDTFYILKSFVRMGTYYTLIPIKLLEEVRNTYPEYLKQF